MQVLLSCCFPNSLSLDYSVFQGSPSQVQPVWDHGPHKSGCPFFYNFGKFSANISLNRLSVPLTSLSGIPIEYILFLPLVYILLALKKANYRRFSSLFILFAPLTR